MKGRSAPNGTYLETRACGLRLERGGRQDGSADTEATSAVLSGFSTQVKLVAWPPSLGRQHIYKGIMSQTCGALCVLVSCHIAVLNLVVDHVGLGGSPIG